MGKNKVKKGNSGKPVSLDIFLGNTQDPKPSQVAPNDYAEETLKAKSLQEIVTLVSALKSQETLTTENFHFCHFNHIETAINSFLPCEVGIVKYSLEGGVSEHYHEFISPGALPIGYAYEAKDHSEKTHKIPPQGFEHANSDYIAIMSSIRMMLVKPDGKLAPLFALEEDIQKTLFIIDWLNEKCYEQDRSHEPSSDIKICSLNTLLFELRRQIDVNNPRLKFTSNAQVSEYLTQTKFLCYENVGCKWHYDEDRTLNCSLALAWNYAYVISDLCCEHYGIRQLPNRHCPAQLLDRYELVPEMKKLNVNTVPSKEKYKDGQLTEGSCGRGSLRNASRDTTAAITSKPSCGRGRGSLLLQ